MLVEDEVAVGVADGLAAASIRADIADDGADLTHCIRTFKHEHHGASALLGFRLRREVLQDIIPYQLLNTAVLGVVG